ncbi:MAG: fumarylacetoacetate hydrolase family protein [Pseudomonadota bacterium]
MTKGTRAMAWLTFLKDGEAWAGWTDGDVVRVLGQGPLERWLNTPAFNAPEDATTTLELKDVELIQPIQRPGKILGIGLNYAAHAAESTSFAKLPENGFQKWFNKQVTAAHPPYADVHLPRVSKALDYEAELVVVIGKPGRHVPEDRAWDIVAGLACGCDYSVRDWQKASPTMIMGKGFDTHAPFGPFLTPLEDIEDVDRLEIRGFVNGELRQRAPAGDMTFSIPQQIAHLSAAFTLEPGDVIFTGTPAGVGQGFDPPKYLKAGDVVRVEIDGLGHIENRVIAEPETTVRLG